MVMYKLDFSGQGKKCLKLLDRETGQRIFDKLKWLIENVDSVDIYSLKVNILGFIS